ncbi:MAG: hypothetical protein ACYTAF_16965 [Planctomycetota bacterium]|jgi:DNA-directed RNA polymerase subunit RPC12/RpoP
MSEQKSTVQYVGWVCLRCGHEYVEDFDPKAPLRERFCPKCRSNSVRRPPKPKK